MVRVPDRDEYTGRGREKTTLRNWVVDWSVLQHACRKQAVFGWNSPHLPSAAISLSVLSPLSPLYNPHHQFAIPWPSLRSPFVSFHLSVYTPLAFLFGFHPSFLTRRIPFHRCPPMFIYPSFDFIPSQLALSFEFLFHSFRVCLCWMQIWLSAWILVHPIPLCRVQRTLQGRQKAIGANGLLARTPTVWLTSKGCHTALIAFIVPGEPISLHLRGGERVHPPLTTHSIFRDKENEIVTSHSTIGKSFYPPADGSFESSLARWIVKRSTIHLLDSSVIKEPIVSLGRSHAVRVSYGKRNRYASGIGRGTLENVRLSLVGMKIM